MTPFEDLRREDFSSPRYRRAARFASTILSLMEDYTPRDPEVRDVMYDYLLKVGYETNAELISVPPECDALDKLALERRMLETKIAEIPVDKRP